MTRYPYHPTIGRNIQRERKARGWTQSEFARRIGVEKSVVSGWEQNRCNPCLMSFVWVCDALEINADRLLDPRDRSGAPPGSRPVSARRERDVTREDVLDAFRRHFPHDEFPSRATDAEIQQILSRWPQEAGYGGPGQAWTHMKLNSATWKLWVHWVDSLPFHDHKPCGLGQACVRRHRARGVRHRGCSSREVRPAAVEGHDIGPAPARRRRQPAPAVGGHARLPGGARAGGASAGRSPSTPRSPPPATRRRRKSKGSPWKVPTDTSCLRRSTPPTLWERPVGNTVDMRQQEWSRLVTSAWRAGVRAIVTVGQILIEAKADLPHGHWKGWIEHETPISERTARKLMQIASTRIFSNISTKRPDSLSPFCRVTAKRSWRSAGRTRRSSRTSSATASSTPRCAAAT